MATKPNFDHSFWTNTRPKSWWLAQTLLYGLPGNKSSTIGQLRERLQAALRQPKGMTVPEKILNMELEGNKEFNQLNTRIALKTQPSTSKGKARATDDLPAPKLSRPKAPEKPKPAAKPARLASTTTTSRIKKGGTSTPLATAAAPSGSTKVRRPKATHDQPPVKRERVKRVREDEIEVDLWLEYEGREGPYLEPGPLRKRARQEQPTGPFSWPYETTSTLHGARFRYHSRYDEDEEVISWS